jgi:hypothetical protein
MGLSERIKVEISSLTLKQEGKTLRDSRIRRGPFRRF